MVSLAVVAWILLRGLRLVSRHLPVRTGPVVRQGIANLYRPGNHAGAAVMALGVGVMFTVAVWIVQRGLLRDIVRTAPPGMPNVYLLDMTAANRQAVYDLLAKQPGVEGSPEIVGAVSAQIVSIDGVTFRREELRGVARRYARTISVSAAPSQPRFTRVVSGAWWPAASHPAVAECSVAEDAAKILNLHVGSVIAWSTPIRTFQTRVAAIHKSENVRLVARIEFYLTPGVLEGLPAIYYGGVRAPARYVPAIQKAVYDRFPTVTVVNMADVLDIIQSVVDQISMVVRFISGFSIFAGAVILASSVAGTRFRRIREVVILKTLGATRGRIARIFSVEFLVIGLVAGLVGGLLAGGFAWFVLKDLLRAEARLDLVPVFASIAGTAVIAIATGWLASYRTLGQKPLEILRDE
jgi:putative ABC transport system permease protein